MVYSPYKEGSWLPPLRARKQTYLSSAEGKLTINRKAKTVFKFQLDTIVCWRCAGKKAIRKSRG